MMIIPILDYADVVWGDKTNATFMGKIEVLHTGSSCKDHSE